MFHVSQKGGPYRWVREYPGHVSWCLFIIVLHAWLWPFIFMLSGFDCRCGNLFCGIHRYSDKHNCPYDYKADAAAKIRKENPVVVADKIQRI